MPKRKVKAPITKALIEAKPEILAKVPDKRVLLNVGNHDVTVREFKIFELYCECRSYTKTAEKAEISVAVMYRLKNQDWWGEMVKTFLGSRQDELHMGLSEEIETLKDAIISIWKGTIGEPKLASAIIKSAEVWSKMGKSHGKAYLEPLIQSKRDLYVDNSVNIDKNYNVDMSPFFHRMTLAEMEQYSRDGKPIQRFITESRVLDNDNVVDAEVIENTDEDWL